MTAHEFFAPGLESEGPLATLRIPPSAVEAESSVLGGLLLSAGAWDRVGDILTESDFYRHEHRLIFGAISRLALACKEVDVVTVYDVLEKDGKGEEVGGLAYLNALAQFVPSAANIRRYALIVREKSVLRRLVATSDEIASEAFNLKGKELDALLEEAVQKLMAIDSGVREDDWENIDVGIAGVVRHIQNVADGSAKVDVISLGIRDLDERLDGGGRPGELIVVGARPSVGKSVVGASFGISAAEAGEQVAFWTGEMPRQQLWTRVMSMRSSIHLSRLKRPDRLRDFDWPNITKGVESLRGFRFVVNDTAGLTITKLRSKARAAKRKGGLRMLIVDHLGLMEPTDPRVSRQQQIGEITRGLKRLAKELGIVVILLVQLNREIQKRVDQTPMLSDLRESGDIEQDADIVMFLHRPYYYKPDLGDEWKHYGELIVAKLRDGSPGAVPILFVGENVRISDWPDGEPVPSSPVRVKRADRGMGDE